MTNGIIIKGIGGFYYVKTPDGVIHETHAAGRFRKEKKTPLVGDRVTLTDNLDSISDILERKCEFVRPPVANIDTMIVVVSVTSPSPNLNLTDKILFCAETKGIDALLCINKTDLGFSEDVAKLKDIYSKAGYTVIETSTEEKTGKGALQSVLKDKITAFAGNSGVGKSSLLNFVETDFALDTGEVSRKIQRGRHTTRHVELMELSFGGYVLDTPGFGKLDLPMMPEGDVMMYFREFKKYLNHCKHSDCLHTDGCEDCAVINAVESGEISESRYESYKSFCLQMKDYKKWETNN